MGKLTPTIFDPSCCDGGETGLDDKSTQPCGCDKGADYISPWCPIHNEVGLMSDQKDLYGNPPQPFQTTAQWRKERPLARGVLDYFPDALLEVAYCSFIGNKQHHDGKPLHWDKSKSTDEADACVRHLMDRGKLDSDGVRHSAKAAWRALANLQREIEDEKGK